MEVSKVLTDDDTERATVDLAEAAEPGDWTLRLGFAGELNPRLTGFYRSTYTDGDGRTQVVGTTHFEATDARRAFPCWDEPDLKAVFATTLVVKEGLTAVSNGPEVEREALGDGRVRIRFADTMKMSTYLAAWVVGPLELTEPADAGGVPVRIVHVPGKGALTGFAVDSSVHSLNWFADYYDIPYPEAKLDNVALPDFAQGAMENVGCVTYREQVLLIDPTRSTQEEQLGVAETVAHELAHMWFGDLVTMRWWNGIWLNEAFATFMSMLAVDDFRPDWEIWNTFTRDRSNAFEVDALETTRRSNTRSARPTMRAACSTPSRTSRVAPCCGCSSSGWARTGSATGSVGTSPRTPTGTPRRTTCGTPSRRRRGSRSAGRWTPGSSSRATRRSR